MAKPSRGRSSSRTASNSVLDKFLLCSCRLFRKFFQGLLCLSALVLGYRLSGEAVFFLGPSSRGALFLKRTNSNSLRTDGIDVALKFPYVTEATRGKQAGLQQSLPEGKSTRVHVGRHEILIRPQPHPDPVQIMKAHNLLNIVQRQQTLLYDSDEQKQQLLIITPTFARTFQALHLTCLIHTLRNVPFPLTWIVVEADGLSNETADLLAHSQLPFHHLAFSERMPAPLDQRWQLEIRLRIEGLRFIRTNRLDGIVLFVDDSNTYSLDFFKEAQRTKWMGGFSIGLLPDFGGEEGKSSTIMPVLHLRGPVCDASGQISGWYTPFKVRNDLHISDQSALDWAGFSLNAKLLWEGFESPAGFIKWNRLFQEKPNLFVSPLNFVRNYTLVQPLGDCGRSILLWRSRVEARADSKFPSRWEINPGLEIVVPSKRTPWVDHHLQRHRSTRHSDLTDLNQKHRGRVRRKLKVPV